MPSSRKEKQLRKKNSDNEKPLIPTRYQHLTAVVVLLVSLVIFFHTAIFEGKVFVSPDIEAAHTFSTLLKDAKAEGIFPLWNPYIFCGMPGFASLTFSGGRWYDLTKTIYDSVRGLFAVILVNKTVGNYILYYLLFGVGLYFFSYYKLKNKIASLIVALAGVFSTFIIIWAFVGHLTKIAVIALSPWIFLSIDKIRLKWSLLWALFLVLCIHFMLGPGMIQMIFYVFFAVGIYYVYYLLRSIVKRENWKGVVRSGIVMICASAIALLMSSDQYLSTLEYSKYSIRGSSPIVQTASQSGENESPKGGLDYSYATNWSFGTGEVFTFLVPSLYGFGWQTYQGVLSRNEPIRLNTYFGPQPFTDAPMYMGIVILLLAIIGVIKKRKDPFVQYLSLLVILALLISFGKYMPLLYNLMFYHFPMFDKFRSPSMILVLVQIGVPLLAGYGIVSLLETREAFTGGAVQRKWLYVLIGVVSLFVLSIVGKGIFTSIYSSFFSESDVASGLARQYGNLQPQVFDELYKFISNSVAADVAFALFVLSLTVGGFYFYWKRSISYAALSAILVFAVVFDLWRVDYEPMHMTTRHQENAAFEAPDYVHFLQSDTTLYRTLQFENGQPPYSNMLAYWKIQSAYGYQAAKMREYQNTIDVAGINNPLVWKLMDVKYIISNTEVRGDNLKLVYSGSSDKVYLNLAALPRAFFVNSYKVASAIAILDSIRSNAFNPMQVGYFMTDPKVKIDSAGPGARVEYTHYGIQDLDAKVTATGRNLVFFSESYYPLGWKAFIDGQPTKIYRLDYMFRGVIVPPGAHTIKMVFEPEAYYLGRSLVLGSNAVVLGAMAVIIFIPFFKKKKSQKENNEETQ